MENEVIINVDNCYICNEYMGCFVCELSTLTTYSKKPISNLIELFTNIELNEVVVAECGVCQNCYIRCNEYDEHVTTAEQIQCELLSLLQAKQEQSDADDGEANVNIKIEEMEAELEYESLEDMLINQEEEPRYEEIEAGEIEVHEETIENENDELQFEIVMDEENSADNDKQTDSDSSKPHISSKSTYKPRPKTKELDEEMTIKVVDGQRLFECSICFKTFKDRSKLRVHREIHTDERNIICEICNKAFKTANCLRNHKRLHTDRVYYECEFCDKKYTQKIQLKKHVSIVHLLKRDFNCEDCGAAFGTKSVLVTHKLSHQEYRKEACTICGFRVHTKAKLRRHMKSHTGERNYECHICKRKFLYSYNVVAHIRSVHKEKHESTDPFSCEICSVKFWKVHKLHDHMRTVHQIEINETIEYENPTAYELS